MRATRATNEDCPPASPAAPRLQGVAASAEQSLGGTRTQNTTVHAPARAGRWEACAAEAGGRRCLRLPARRRDWLVANRGGAACERRGAGSEAEKRVKVMHGQLKQAWGELNQAYQALEREREQSNLRVQDQKAALESESALKGNLESSMSNLKAFEELQESVGEITSGSSEEAIEQNEQSQAKSWWGFSARK